MSETPSPQSAIPSDRMVGFGAAIQLGLANYFQFSGRSSRGAYWYWTLFVVILDIIATFGDMSAFPGNEWTPISSILSLAILLPGIGVSVRRLHDIGKTGWWILIAFTIIGIFLLIYWAVQPGQRAENNYGPDREAGR